MVSPQQPPQLVQATGHYNRAQELISEATFDKAIDELSKAIALVPEMHDYRSLRGRCYYRIGNYADALQDLNQAISLNPDGLWQSSDLYHRGACFLSTQKYPEAIADFSQAIAHIDAEVNEMKAFYKEQGFDDEPMGEWQMQLYAFAHWRRADAYEQLGNQAQAKSDRKAASKFKFTSTGEPESDHWWSDDE